MIHQYRSTLPQCNFYLKIVTFLKHIALEYSELDPALLYNIPTQSKNYFLNNQLTIVTSGVFFTEGSTHSDMKSYLDSTHILCSPCPQYKSQFPEAPHSKVDLFLLLLSMKKKMPQNSSPPFPSPTPLPSHKQGAYL